MKKAIEERIAIGARLRQEREKKCLNQLELAELIGVGRYAVMKYESGINSPSAEQLNLLSKHNFDTNFIATGLSATLTQEDRKVFNQLTLELWKLALQKESSTSIEKVLNSAWVAFDNYKSNADSGFNLENFKALIAAINM